MTPQQVISTNSSSSRSYPTRILSALLFLFIAMAPVLLFERVGLSKEATQKAEKPTQTAPTGVTPQSKESQTAKQENVPAAPKGNVPTASATEQLPKDDQTSPQQNEKGLIEVLENHRIFLGTISILFTAIPLSLAVLYLMVALHMGSADIKERFMPFFGEGRLGEVIVIILIAGNVCSLAIMKVLNTGEVASIYSGIIGYVLGKSAAGNKQPPAPPDMPAKPATP